MGHLNTPRKIPAQLAKILWKWLPYWFQSRSTVQIWKTPMNYLLFVQSPPTAVWYAVTSENHLKTMQTQNEIQLVQLWQSDDLDQGGEITHLFLQLMRDRRPRWIVFVRSLKKMDLLHYSHMPLPALKHYTSIAGTPMFQCFQLKHKLVIQGGKKYCRKL